MAGLGAEALGGRCSDVRGKMKKMKGGSWESGFSELLFPLSGCSQNPVCPHGSNCPGLPADPEEDALSRPGAALQGGKTAGDVTGRQAAITPTWERIAFLCSRSTSR